MHLKTVLKFAIQKNPDMLKSLPDTEIFENIT
jgi:hypothetical protein